MHRQPDALRRLRGLEPGDLILCSSVAAEIHFGIERLAPGSRRQRLLRAEYARLRDALEWRDWTEEASALFGLHKADLERRGERIDDMDVAIAALALSLRAPVATLNARHLRRVEGLAVEDWGSAP